MATATGERVQFRNNTEGYIGAVQYAPNGDERAIAVAPGETVWLSSEEQEITARAPKSAKDNPFIEQQVPVMNEDGAIVAWNAVTPLTADDEERPFPSNSERPFPSRELRPEAKRYLDKGDAPDGTFGPDEEVGTPAAQKPPAKRATRKASK